jgi:hypothetical protein
MRITRTLALFVGLSVIAACKSTNDDQQTSEPTAPALPPTVPPSPPQVTFNGVWLGSQIRELMVGGSFVLRGSATLDVLDAPDTTLAITWRTDEQGSMSVQAMDGNRVRVRGEHAGTGWVEGRAMSAASYLYVTVLDAAAPGVVSPIVVDDFHVVEHHYGLNDPELTYSPQITLHDSTSSGGAAVIAASFEIPGLAPSEPCGMLRPAGAAPRKVFVEGYREFELNIRQPGRSSSVGAKAVAHLTIRLPNNTATTMTVDGPVVSGPIPFADDGWPDTADYLACD